MIVSGVGGERGVELNSIKLASWQESYEIDEMLQACALQC